jgi:signal transduction histidine kinase
MMNEKRFSYRLFGAFGAVAIAFVAATILADWRTLAIDRETQALLTDAMPSMEYLSIANDAVRDIETAADDYPEVPVEQRAAAHANVERLWRIVDAQLARYQALPAFPGETELYRELPVALRDLDGVVRALWAEVEAGGVDKARIEADDVVRPRAYTATHILHELVRVNATNAVDSANRINQTRHATIAVSAALNAVAILLTIGTAGWVFRLFRSHNRLQRAHAELVEHRADELEVFSRRVAHDLLSPLSSLTFCLTAFKKVSEREPKLEHALTRARQCVLRAQQLVDNVFDFARSGGAPNPAARTEIQEAVEQVVDDARGVDAADAAQIEVGPLPKCAVRCSRGVLASILGNLVRNAVKYMRDSVIRSVIIRVTEAGDFVRFEVEDTGPGIPVAIEDTLFQPYVRGEGVTQPGLGLGLATVKRFCEAYGGTVGARSQPGRGSVFFFTLPRAASSSTPAPPSARDLGDVAEEAS